LIKTKTKYWNTETIISNDIDNFDYYYDDVFISVTCSGTASLEIAKRNIPQIVIYKLNFLTELIFSFIVKVRKACLLNIISNKIIIPEVVNSNLSKKNLIHLFEKLLKDENYRNNQIKNVNNHITEFESKESPFDISAKRIMDLL
jgi:Lipid A disaccharide synthetase